MDKTIIVAVQWQTRHPLYRKSQRRITKFYAHDGANSCTLGDLVRIEETRSLSRLKAWRLLEILERREVPEVKPLELDLPILEASGRSQMGNEVNIVADHEPEDHGATIENTDANPASGDSGYDSPEQEPSEEITATTNPTSSETEVAATQAEETPLIELPTEPIEDIAQPRRKTTSKAQKQNEPENTDPASDTTSSKEEVAPKPSLKRRSAKAKLDDATTTGTELRGIGETTENAPEESTRPAGKEETI
jgi:small subunit ribosomal protein S17